MNNSQRLRNLIPNYNLTGIYSISDIQRHATGHFFNKDSMHFFNSRICNDVIPMTTQVLFITSEKFDYKKPRLYTIRSLDLDARSINTIGEFQAYTSKQKALTAALKWANGEA